MIPISPMEIKGEWAEGYALDFHTISSEFLGYENGRERFETTRLALGELLYRLKSINDLTVRDEIARVVVDFVRQRNWQFDLIVPVPPSSPRNIQPVAFLADEIARAMGIACCTDCVVKIKDTPELKNVFDLSERRRLLADGFRAERSRVERKCVLLFDDLYRSGATMNEIAATLQKAGGAVRIFALALTKTRVYR